MSRFVSLALLLFQLTLSAATYYINFAAGSDTNNGTAKETPWQRHPYMKGWTGSYSHAAGDQFIFKGGVTWDNTCFLMCQLAGGSVGNPDYYGVDKTWYSGGSWTRPVFSCNSTALGGNAANIQLKLNSANTVLDNIEFAGFYWTSTNGGYQCGILQCWNTNITVQNCLFHNWTHASAASGTANEMRCIVFWSGGADGTGTFTGPGGDGRGCIVSNCVVNGPGPSDSSGCGFSGILPELTIGNSFSNVPTAMLWSTVTNSTVVPRVCYTEFAYFPGSAFDGGHPNVCEQVGWPYGTNEWDHNIVHDTHQEDNAVPVFYWTGGGVAWENTMVALVHDNLIYNVGRAPIETGRQGPNIIRSWNNTLVPPVGSPGFACDVGTNIVSLYSTNDHVITDYVYSTGFSNVYAGSNLLQTFAAATVAGYTAANLYRPPSASSPTVNRGTPTPSATDLIGVTRPQGGAWDIGAYEFVAPAVPSNGPGVPPMIWFLGACLVPAGATCLWVRLEPKMLSQDANAMNGGFLKITVRTNAPEVPGPPEPPH